MGFLSMQLIYRKNQLIFLDFNILIIIVLVILAIKTVFLKKKYEEEELKSPPTVTKRDKNCLTTIKVQI